MGSMKLCLKVQVQAPFEEMVNKTFDEHSMKRLGTYIIKAI